MTADLTSDLNFTAGRHRPVKKRVETCHAHAAGRWFDVFEESRKTPDNFLRVQIFGNATKFIERNAGLVGASNPRRWLDFLRSEFALKRKQDAPFAFAELDLLHWNHFRGLTSFASGLNRFTPNMSNTECENAFRRHCTKTLRANFFRQQFTMRQQRESLRNL